ncbi:MAG TPA: trehalose-phosphatase [Acidimicrobiales bacterium]|jgi:trehalose 6-phosphate phosphatase|nr:trehalose-phosphatase [Acidimicrobiales bacterium]
MASLDHLLKPFLDRPERAGILTDFDGTLAPIVDDPAGARPLPGAVVLLHRLTRHYRRVAVISGRPAAFLTRVLRLDHDEVVEGEAAGEGLIVSGLYGLEAATGGVVTAHPDCETWRPVIERVADEAEEQAPPGVYVERKGLTVTLHYRTAPDQEGWVGRWSEEAAARAGLAMHPARMSVELLPPIPTDKGRVVAELSQGLVAACFFGDDVGDIPAFQALGRLDAATLKVVVRSPESAPELLDEADVVVDGPEGALALLSRLLPATGRPASPAASGPTPRP